MMLADAQKTVAEIADLEVRLLNNRLLFFMTCALLIPSGGDSGIAEPSEQHDFEEAISSLQRYTVARFGIFYSNIMPINLHICLCAQSAPRRS
jgi:hypothetical protein